MNNPIKLNDILRLADLSIVKIRFNLQIDEQAPIDLYNQQTTEANDKIMRGHHWNYDKNVFRVGEITLAFIPLTTPPDDRWLLVYIGKITANLNKKHAVGYEYETLKEYENLFGRLVVRFHNISRGNMVRKADSNGFMDQLIVETILSDTYNGNMFPGYDNVNISWRNLKVVINNDSWKTALQNQKGVYLLTDRNTGKMYVGSASGDDMLLGRWQQYIDTCHGSDKELMNLDVDYIKENFWFSILEIYKGTVDRNYIIARENHWKEVLRTRVFGYNAN